MNGCFKTSLVKFTTRIPMKKIVQINVKPNIPMEHGIPKISVNTVMLLESGLEGDYNNFRTNKKDQNPDMAVLVYPIETIHELSLIHI